SPLRVQVSLACPPVVSCQPRWWWSPPATAASAGRPMTPTGRRRTIAVGALPDIQPSRFRGDLMIWLAVCVGGALGSLARHEVNVFFGHVLERAVPWATATVNVVGSLAIGLLGGLLAVGRIHMSTEMRTFVFVGILGGFTTFSSFMLDTFTLGHGGDHAV